MFDSSGLLHGAPSLNVCWERNRSRVLTYGEKRRGETVRKAVFVAETSIELSGEAAEAGVQKAVLLPVAATGDPL